MLDTGHWMPDAKITIGIAHLRSPAVLKRGSKVSKKDYLQ